MIARSRLVAGVLALVLAACDDTARQDACPLLAPGALVDFERLALGPEMLSSATDGLLLNHAELGPGRMLAISFHSDGFETVSASLAGNDGLEIIAWGPRDSFGGYPHCLSRHAATVTFDATTRGEYLLGIGARSGRPETTAANTIRLKIARRREVAAPSRPPCATLEDLGCGAVRCDGELESDADGCLTCNCRSGTPCGPERAAGPAGSCVLPACDCTGERGPVCGADGNTWPSACDAHCAAVPVAVTGACATACPGLDTCNTPCFGRRRIDPTSGCPTCECMPAFAPDAASCAACPRDPAPVCGSDGVTWLNRCTARCGGARVLYAGACVPDCTRAPDNCDLDCAFGLVPAESGDACLTCRCAAPPTFDCPAFGANACAALPAFADETTVANACTAVSLGATAGRWGSCALSCTTDDDCATALENAGIDDVPTPFCQTDGFMSNRCQTTPVGAAACGCATLVDLVCGADGRTHLNLCAARCAGVAIAHPGPCCPNAAPACTNGTVAELDTHGCPSGACVTASDAVRGRSCADNARTAPACTSDGTPVNGTACDNHLRGVSARPEFCR